MTSSPNVSDLHDHELVTAAREGREDAYAELLRRHHEIVHTFINRLVRDPDLADDLTQEAFVKAFSQLESHRPEHSFSSWILRIANNHAVDHLRRERSLKSRGLDTVPLDPTPDVSGPRAIAAHRLRAIVSDTPTPTRWTWRRSPRRSTRPWKDSMSVTVCAFSCGRSKGDRTTTSPRSWTCRAAPWAPH
jgi:RNA polymerase sigma factor (sigma-70 family)